MGKKIDVKRRTTIKPAATIASRRPNPPRRPLVESAPSVRCVPEELNSAPAQVSPSSVSDGDKTPASASWLKAWPSLPYWDEVLLQDNSRIKAYGKYLDNLQSQSNANELLIAEGSVCLQAWHRLMKTDNELAPGLPLLLERFMVADKMHAIMKDRASTPNHKRMAAVLRKVLLSTPRAPFSGHQPPARAPYSGLQLPGRPPKESAPQKVDLLLPRVLAHLNPIWERFSTPSKRRLKAQEFRRAIAADSLFCTIPEGKLPTLRTLQSPSLYVLRLARHLARRLPIVPKA